ncbi:MAG: 1-deoxy-D-xylulose-5-phosphate reductoisomerase, partial [Syntrophomonadaceae bacterium]|nr:1-deoxy-D-xylulose-5-phosphate reductoisomerase [Syntrophomonadaceae bacterium]
NAANEAAVHSFLAGGLNWWQIPIVVERVMELHHNVNGATLDDILAADKEARALAESVMASLPKS